MIGTLLLFLQTAAAAPPNLVIRQGDAIRIVPVTASTAGTYVRADLLAAALGGSAGPAPNPRYFRLTLGDTRFDMLEGVPFARNDTVVVPLLLPPLRSGHTFLVPFQMVTSLIPRLASGFLYDRASREMRIFSTVARSGTQVAPAGEIRGPPPSLEGSQASAARSPATTGAAATATRPRRNQRRLVVVDAGHGGPDNGMTGPIGRGPRIVEKHVTLSVARLVADELKRQGVDILMTRTTDTLIALSDRGRIANRNKGDLFVSIHVNAAGTRGPVGARQRGFETYFLAEAKTEEAARVERMENEAVKFETGAYAPKGDPLSFIINDMAQNEHLRESNDLAEVIQQGLRTFHPGPNRGVQQANFAVLRGSFMPAVLVEIGFGSNPREAEYLLSSANQREIAASVARSVITYLDRYEARIGGALGSGAGSPGGTGGPGGGATR